MATRKKAPQAAPGRPIELPGAWGELAEKAGGVGALCELLGVHKTTLYRWIAGTHPIGGPARIALDTVATRLGARAP